MTDFEKIWSFENLYRAHLRARLGKRHEAEVIDFERELSANLVCLSERIRNNTYRISGYYSFKVYDPKERDIHALHYRDRVVQHCICDDVLEPVLDKALIYDMVLLHHDKEYLRYCRDRIRHELQDKRQLETNDKTKIFPIRNGVNYLGFHFYMTDTGKVIRKVKQATKKKYKKKVRQMQYQYALWLIDFDDVKAVLNSYRAHLAHGNCYRLNCSMLNGVWYRRGESDE